MKFSIGKKIWLGFGSILLLLAVMGGGMYITMQSITHEYQGILDEDMKRIQVAKEIEITQNRMASSVLEYAMFGKESTVAQLDAQIEEGSANARVLIEKTTDDRSKVLLEDLKTQTVLLFEVNEKILELKRANEPLEALINQSSELNESILTILSELVEIQEQSVVGTRAELDTRLSSTLLINLCFIIFSVIAGISIAYFISRSIVKPTQLVTGGLEEIANGNLTIAPINVKNRDEIGIMANTFNKMLSDLQGIVANVRDSSMYVASSAEQLSASSQESSASSQMVARSSEQQMFASEQQVGHLQTTATDMAELSEHVVKISDDNEQMLLATDGVNVLVTQGATVVSDVANQMEIIHETFTETTGIIHNMAQHSNEIEAVTKLITDISDQTNLLALNAAIEAARAGDAGKGFAVVADEVRKLAEQSKASATEIATMVQLIQTASSEAVKAISVGGSKVKDGIEKTTESLAVFNEIENGVSNVVTKAESVSVAIKEIQSMAVAVVEGTKQVQALVSATSEASQEVGAATEQQLAATEEISANAQVLADLAEKLHSDMNHFKL